MKRIKQGPNGHEDIEELNVHPGIPTIEEMEGGGGGGGLSGSNDFVKTYKDTHETAAKRAKRAPDDGHFTVEIDPRGTHLKLPEHPRGEGWIDPNPSN